MGAQDTQAGHVTSISLGTQSSGASPIADLNEDLLRLIFQFNIESAVPLYVSVNLLERPLTSARLSSQVCRSWRYLLLGSPSIWGKLIDLDSLDQKGSEWREELLRRTQSSPLHIRGNVTGSDEDSTPVRMYFHRLLGDSTCWERVERLEIVVHGPDTSDSAWNAFLSPAPKLQTFEAYFPDLRDSVKLSGVASPDNVLFGNHAPSLREFHADAVDFPTDASWLSNLRLIDIPSRLTVPEILNLLAHTPLLQCVFVQGSLATEEWLPIGDLPHVELPALTTTILLSNSLATCSTLLEHIHPTKTCSLSLSTISYYDKRFVSNDVLRSFQQNLPRYIHNYFNTYISTRVRLRFLNHTFHFEDESDRHNRHILFSVNIPTRSSEGADGTELTNILLQIFTLSSFDSPSQFSHVTTLSLDMRHAETSSLPYFYSFFSSFSSVQDLKTNEDSIVFLHSLSELEKDRTTGDKASLFPSLDVLQLTYLDPDHYLELNAIHGSLLPFLKDRKESGLPINTLDLRLCSSDTLRDIDFLEEIEGLKVLTEEGGVEASYICGSGRPEKLRFRTKSGWKHRALTVETGDFNQ